MGVVDDRRRGVRRKTPAGVAHGGVARRWGRRLARRDPTFLAVGLVVLVWLVAWPFGPLPDLWLLTLKAAATVGIVLPTLLIQHLQRSPARTPARRGHHARPPY